MASTNTLSFCKSYFSLLIHLMLTGMAVIWAAAHLDLCCLPIDLRVMFAEPGKAEDDVLLS
jgi:hypothetical protein